jgi:hypothetical protein
MTKDFDQVLALIDKETNAVFEANRHKSMQELYVVAEKSMAQRLALLSGLTDEQLELPGLGHGDGTIGGFIAYTGDHMRLHLAWAMEGIANGATVPDDIHAGVKKLRSENQRQAQVQ